MRAFVVERYGDAETVRARDVPDPAVGENDVLVRVHAASVNPLDLKIRSGDLKVILPYRAPFVLGNDLAGTVTASWRTCGRARKSSSTPAPAGSAPSPSSWRSTSAPMSPPRRAARRPIW
ncbi:hypothetical protein ACTI_44620 [Actinoplanes sp. OR16]|uniref:alcohol dehydrogenase catalytic domain-containing protein n=1 Tax=Actinoplanes sp. OR16 TaxID=946334 RepID=UPI000F7105F5|nr:alcohol dehydrogenase catalytic domain-containing protein [Actinoplanes sp. OR16]BBH67777.1 hypothetical protein ACTI_44620 [Actinoplanes sp. OR16]